MTSLLRPVVSEMYLSMFVEMLNAVIRRNNSGCSFHASASLATRTWTAFRFAVTLRRIFPPIWNRVIEALARLKLP